MTNDELNTFCRIHFAFLVLETEQMSMFLNKYM